MVHFTLFVHLIVTEHVNEHRYKNTRCKHARDLMEEKQQYTHTNILYAIEKDRIHCATCQDIVSLIASAITVFISFY